MSETRKGGTRGRQGRIQQLPAVILDRLHELLRGGVSQRDILRRLAPELAAAGEPPLSRSTLNRYSTRMEVLGQRLRQSRDIAAAWTARFGEQATGELGQHVIEILRVLAFEMSLKLSEDDQIEPEIGIEALNGLSLAIKRLEGAAEVGARRERALRTEIASRVAKETDQVMKQQGISEDTAAAIRAAIEGAGE